ncbi:tyrosine-protein kinase [unidentified eubacterium SCB49]|nr:tyrosine-protein kinase [unidentified eubacterium SCB49]
MSNEFDIKNLESTFDVKSFLLKLLSYWPLFLVFLSVSIGIAYAINIRKLPVYSIDNLISIKDDQNPFFTSNTSLTFNWGGTTDKVNTALITLKSRTHNEDVVDALQYYVVYKKNGEYQKVGAYKETPFKVVVDTSAWQLLSRDFKVVFKDSVTFDLSFTQETDARLAYQRFNAEKEVSTKFFPAQEFKKEFKLGQTIATPLFNGVFLPDEEIDATAAIGKEYFVRINNFDQAVKNNISINVVPESQGSSVLRLSKIGGNKARMVDYLNSSVAILAENMLERKNLFATKTIRFIDSSLAEKSKELLDVENELNSFKNKNSVLSLNEEGQVLKSKLGLLDSREEAVERELDYYNTLKEYLLNRTDYRQIPAPSVAGITESSISNAVSRIVLKAEERNRLQYSFKEESVVFNEIDRDINATKRVLLENINSSEGLLNKELASIKREIGSVEYQTKKLPKEQQQLIKIERKYDISQGTYNFFLSKLSEAKLVKAANVGDVLIIDEAKDTGGGKIGPNTGMNYIIAVVLGLGIPVVVVFILLLLNTKVQNIKEIERLSMIPILGAIGKSKVKGNLAVLDNPKSAISEGFRSLRSSLQFIFKQNDVEGSKTLLITSSISGEGKTFCSINIASIFALSGKKTLLIGLDLRKPKIFEDFNITNDIGVVNYLINEASLEQVIQKTSLDSFDVIVSGPIPPNPSELLMGSRMEKMMAELKEEYDYIILDTPPVGLVTDALDLMKFSDATLYVVRQNYTRVGMFQFINEKYKNGEVKDVSFVLNFFQSKTRYGYSHGYGYGYGNNYGNSYGNSYTKNSYHEDEKPNNIIKRILSIFKRKS